MDLEASEPRCRCCCRCRGRPDNDKKTTTTATKKTSTTATNRLLVSKCADVFALPLYLACLFYLACWLSPAGIHLPPADFRLLASCSRLLAVGCCLLQASTIAIARIQHIGGRGRGRGKGTGRGRGRGKGRGRGRGRGRGKCKGQRQRQRQP